MFQWSWWYQKREWKLKYTTSAPGSWYWQEPMARHLFADLDCTTRNNQANKREENNVCYWNSNWHRHAVNLSRTMFHWQSLSCTVHRGNRSTIVNQSKLNWNSLLLWVSIQINKSEISGGQWSIERLYSLSYIIDQTITHIELKIYETDFQFEPVESPGDWKKL